MNTKEAIVKNISKKEARQLVYDRLVIALTEFKTGIKDKKFESKLKKASRLFAVDIAKASHKKKDKKKSKKDTAIGKEIIKQDEKKIA